MTAQQYAAIAVTYGTTAATWWFIGLYHYLTRGGWRTSRLGMHLMMMALVDAAIFTMLTVANIWPVLALQAWYQWLYIATVSGIAVVALWRSWLLWRVYHPTERKPQ